MATANLETMPIERTGLATLDWWRDRIVFLFGIAFLVVMALEFRSHLADCDSPRCFLIAGRHMLAGEAIHRASETYAYPPATAFLVLPICRLPQAGVLVVWYLLNALGMVVLFRSAWQLAGAPAMVGMETRWHGVLWLGALFLAGRFILAPLENLQSDLMVAALVVAGCKWLAEGREIPGGLLIGSAASMKCTPLLFVPYLILRRRWRAAMAVLAAAVIWNVLPDLCFPQANGNSYVGDWSRMYLSFAGKSAPGVWHTDLLLNQSLGGTLNRWFRIALGAPVLDAHLAGHELPAHAVVWLKRSTHAIGLALLAVTAILGGNFFRRLPRNVSAGRSTGGWNQMQESVEFSAILCLMLLLSPMSGKAHFVILFLPCLSIARRVIEKPGVIDLALLGVLILCGPLGSKSLLGIRLGQEFLIWGTPTLFALGSLVWMWRLLVESRRCVVSAGDETIPERRLSRAVAA